MKGQLGLRKARLNGECFWVEVIKFAQPNIALCICRNNLLNLPIKTGDEITLIRQNILGEN